jgi:pSer/pThr/pTyr-binding forkhead associated (FHA) protein
MPILSLKFKKNTIADYQLEKGKSITIGRRGANDIIIENLAVSGHHAKIDSVGDGFVLTDLQSKNGCFVNEQLVTSHWLNNEDIITIGKHTLVFNFQEGESKPQGPPGEMDQTMVMDTSTFRSMVAKSAPKEAAAPEAQKKRPNGLLSYLSGGDGEVALDKKLQETDQNWKRFFLRCRYQRFWDWPDRCNHQHAAQWLPPELRQWPLESES